MSALPEALRKHVDPASPLPLRLMASRGAVPAPPAHTVTMLCMLVDDPDEKIHAGAAQTLAKLPDKILQGALREKLHAVALDKLARALLDKPAMLEPILINQETPDQTFSFLAERIGEPLLAIIVENQVRQLRHPPILKALVGNPALRKSDSDRLMDFAVRTGMDEQFKGVAAYQEAQTRLRSGPVDQAEEKRVQAIIDASLPEDLLKEEEGEDEPRTAEEAEELNKKKLTMLQMLSSLTSGQKVALAQKGNKTVRMTLIKDPNKMVATAAIKNPGINAQEVMMVAGNRGVCDDVIRIIAQNAEWTRNYPIKVALVNNPKTPLGLALKFLPHLRPNDLKSLSMNKNVASALAQAARRLTKH
jgi:hypothetical protein